MVNKNRNKNKNKNKNKQKNNHNKGGGGYQNHGHKKHQAPRSNFTVVITNLPKDIRVESLENFLKKKGNFYALSKNLNKNKDKLFFNFKTKSDAAKLLQLNGINYYGATLSIKGATVDISNNI